MKNEKGFTLIEIIVSLAIGSIALFVAGSVLVNTFRLFGVYSDTTLRKRSLDNVVEYFRKELEYSTDAWYVESFDKIPEKLHSGDKWRCMYVEDGRLYWTNDATKQAKQLFSDGFYNGKENKLSISFTNVIRTSGHMPYNFISLYYSLYNSQDKYEKEDTIQLANLNEELTDELTVDANLQYHTFTSKQSLSSKKLFYRSSNSSSETIEEEEEVTPHHEEDKPKITSTVKDKLYLMTPYLNRGYYEGEGRTDDQGFTDEYPIDSVYNAGDYVYYKGYWYLRLETLNNNNSPDDSNGNWQKLDENYDNNSGYVKGDIVRGSDGQYYKWTGNWNWHVNGLDPVLRVDDRYSQWHVLTDQKLSEVAKKFYSNNRTGNNNDPIIKVKTGEFIYYEGHYYQRSTFVSDKAVYPDDSESFYYWREAEEMPSSDENIYKGHMMLDQSEDKGNSKFTITAPSSSLLVQRKNKYKLDYPYYETKFNGVEEYSSSKDSDYKIGSVVKVKIYDGGGNNHDYYQLYVKIFTDYYKSGITHEPGNKSHDSHSHGLLSGWKLLENEYQPYSSYEQGDWVRIGKRDSNNDQDGIHDYRICFGGNTYRSLSGLKILNKHTLNQHGFNYSEQDIVNQFILQEYNDSLALHKEIWKKPD